METLSNNNPNEKLVFSRQQLEFLNQKLVQMEEDRLLEDDFVGEGKPYTQEFIDGKKRQVETIKQSFLVNNTISEKRAQLTEDYSLSAEYRKLSLYLEALFYHNLGGPHGWIPNAFVWKTAEYDDFVHGVDFLVETQNRELSLATDITFSDSRGLVEKLSKIKHSIIGGTLPEITFYESENKNSSLIPHVIIAVERDRVQKALQLWAGGQEKLLVNHPLRVKTMLELEAQLEAFAMYAKNLGKREIAAVYNDMLSQIQILLSEHEELIEKHRNIIEEDQAYRTIVSFCDSLKEEKKV